MASLDEELQDIPREFREELEDYFKEREQYRLENGMIGPDGISMPSEIESDDRYINATFKHAEIEDANEK